MYVSAVLNEYMDLVFEKEANKLAEEVMHVVQEHGRNYEAPAWRRLMARAQDLGLHIQFL